METVTDLIFLGSKITADGDCSHEIKRCFAPWKKIYDQARHQLKSRDISLPTKVSLVKAMVFPVVMYGCESWTIKKAESWRIDAFELWCWRRLLRFPWTSRRAKQSILKEVSLKYSLEGLMVKMKLQYSGYLMQIIDSFEKNLMLGKIEGERRMGWQWVRWLDSITDSMDVSKSWSWWWTWKPSVRQSMGSQSIRHNWTELNWREVYGSFSNFVSYIHSHS